MAYYDDPREVTLIGGPHNGTKMVVRSTYIWFPRIADPNWKAYMAGVRDAPVTAPVVIHDCYRVKGNVAVYVR